MLDVDISKFKYGSYKIKKGFAKMQKNGVVMDVTNSEQALIAEESGAVAVMALERVPADIRSQGGVARMADPKIIEKIMDSVNIPVMAKVRIGHFAEAQVLESIGVDMIDESEVVTPADPFYHINKNKFDIPFVCGCRNLGEAVRRIWEGAAMIRTKGEAGTGNIVEAIRHQRMLNNMIRLLKKKDKNEIFELSKNFSDSYVNSIKILTNEKINNKTILFDNYSYETILKDISKILEEIKKIQRLPVVNFAAGGIATPSDAAIMMQLGSDGVFVGSGIFKSEKPEKRARSIVQAVTHYDKPEIISDVSKNIGHAMNGIEMENIPKEKRLQERGW